MLLSLPLCFLAQQPIALERVVVPSAGIVQPVDIQSRPGDSRFFVAERNGRVKIVVDGTPLGLPFADLSARVAVNGDTGLRSFAFAPDHPASGHVFLWYDAENGTDGVDGVLVRMTTMVGNEDRLDPASLVEVLRVPQDGKSHGGGHIGFDPEGRLLLGIGDGKPGGDPMCRAQDRSNLLGTMIRIDVSGALPYTIPADNPFIGMAGVRPEILHYGLRHPWKWCVDSSNGDLWIADVGEVQREEVDYIPAGGAGLNFGWPAVEGSTCFTGDGCAVHPDCTEPTFTAPVFEYNHGMGCSITGGRVAESTSVPDLNGAFVFTDFCSHRIWSARSDGAGSVNVIEHGVTVYPSGANLTLPVTFGIDGQGELLIADYVDGEIYRVAPADSLLAICDGMPNVAGPGASMTPAGSTILSRNDLVLNIAGTAPYTLGILFYGPGATSVPAGNGMRCVDPGGLSLFRAGVRVASGSGTMSFALDLESHPFNAGLSHVQAGSTWVFQAWYRDIGGPLGASTNFSGAIAARFRP
ncbi:Soluble aldose sugar dehydrogenase YliI precursor [Planctomycetes bacterium Poly30]|uniref:Soluble aldose sugar dehydrogenase YliI n=1 Tax=Saltatorellus ferox TaxID=2528018 RepID=A0A518EZH9_9BACT|nr:Soluble aldose sugar dehydrogenase YliI precursor [Planctomycetes bacterium Poly30]